MAVKDSSRSLLSFHTNFYSTSLLSFHTNFHSTSHLTCATDLEIAEEKSPHVLCVCVCARAHATQVSADRF